MSIDSIRSVANPDSVLSFELRFTTTAPVIATLHVEGPGASFTAKPEARPAREHSLPVVGLRERSTYQAWVTVPSNGRTVASKKVTITTGALPADLPPITTTSNPKLMAPGVTLFTVTLLAAPTAVPGTPAPMLGTAIAVDSSGNVVWYHRTPLPLSDARMMPNGHILYEYNDMGGQEIDILGHLVREWAGRLERGALAQDQYGRTVAGPDAIPVDTDSIHHELSVLPNGNFLTISTELRTVEGFAKPLCGEAESQFTGSYQLISDVIVEFDPDTGRVVRQFPIADYLHPQTNSADANICGPGGVTMRVVPNSLYPSAPDAHDWTHANAVILDAKHNRLLVSIRHLDTVLAIRYRDDRHGRSGAQLWRLGPDGGDFKLVGSGLWQYHQHALELEADGSLLLYDNGNDRPDTDPFFSRAVRYEIHDRGPRSKWTVRQQWEFRSSLDDAPAYAFFVGDADQLSNGNVLIDNGGIALTGKGVNAQIVEVKPAGRQGGTVVFDLRVTGPLSFAYRARRIPSLYSSRART